MDADAIGALLFFAALATLLYQKFRRPARQRILITDYQCGLRYIDGVFLDQVGPGFYRVNGSKQQITVVDLRPRLVVVERIFYQDALQSSSVISVGAELLVSDAHIAATKLKDPTTDSLSILRDAVRVTVSKGIAGHSPEAREATGREIQKVAKLDLNKVGMTVSNIEITEAWSRPVEPRMSTRAN